MNPCPDTHYTPIDIVENILNDIKFIATDNTLEPCKGRTNNFYNLIPYNKDWCEIDEGRDIFTYDFNNVIFTKIITNPPYRTNHIDAKDRQNIAIKVIEKCFELCSDECWFLLNNQMMNSLTPVRLTKYKNINWEVNFIRILNIKKWYGRYYWVCFKKHATGILHF